MLLMNTMHNFQELTRSCQQNREIELGKKDPKIRTIKRQFSKNAILPERIKNSNRCTTNLEVWQFKES